MIDQFARHDPDRIAFKRGAVEPCARIMDQRGQLFGVCVDAFTAHCWSVARDDVLQRYPA